MFRDHGEGYIRAYRPGLRVIRLIRAVRLCRTAALGGHRVCCVDCGAIHYRYFSCGHSHCPLCQGDRRRAWYERVEGGLLEVPYLHVTFTLPHELNGICRLHPRALYGMLFRVAWQTLRELVDGLPGMTSVLHTWGSDLKHHPHVHCLVTFGGLDEQHGRWCWPKYKDKLVKHHKLCNTFRDNFLRALKDWMTRSGREIYHQSYGVLTAGLEQKRWVVNQQRPTMDAEVINAYLSRYICRIGISDKRLRYDAATQTVELTYNDYRRQAPGEAAPQATRQLPPLVAMANILQHVLPAHFHRTRSYGLHAANTRKRLGPLLKGYVKQTPDTVLMVMRLLKAMLRGQLRDVCEQCGSVTPPLVELVAPDHRLIAPWLGATARPPPVMGKLTQTPQQSVI